MDYLHVDTLVAQVAKRPLQPCGDVVCADRSPSGTLLVLCDGQGSGVRANLYAEMIASRLRQRLLGHCSLRQAFAETVRTLEKNRGVTVPWGACAVARVLPKGDTTILTYESPPPLFFSGRQVQVLPARPSVHGCALPAIGEANCFLKPNEGLMLVSDGITQAGLGRCIPGMPEGWGIEGVRDYLSQLIRAKQEWQTLPDSIQKKALSLWTRTGDDCTTALLMCRRGITLSIMTGPPVNRENDAQAVQKFMKTPGLHIVCGGTTANVVARETGRKLEVNTESATPLTPPAFQIQGLDLVTEGAVTLNQLYNLLDMESEQISEQNPTVELHQLIGVADRVRFFYGKAANPSEGSLAFRQLGVLQRRQILPMIAEKLKAAGKLVETIEI
jgi:hypothetical protein